MQVGKHLSIDPQGLHVEPPRLHCKGPWSSTTLFSASKLKLLIRILNLVVEYEKIVPQYNRRRLKCRHWTGTGRPVQRRPWERPPPCFTENKRQLIREILHASSMRLRYPLAIR